MKISDQHHPDSPIALKAARLAREKANHRAFVMSIPGVHPNWYSPTRWRNSRKQIMIYCNRDTVIWLETAIRSAPPDYDMKRAVTVRQGIMLIFNKLRAGVWSDEEINAKIERNISPQSDITVTMLKKVNHALQLATGNALDFRKDFAQSLWNLTQLTAEQIMLLRPRFIPTEFYLPPLDEMLDLTYIKELPPGVSPEPEWTPAMTPEYIEKRRLERAAYHYEHRKRLNEYETKSPTSHGPDTPLDPTKSVFDKD